MEGLWEPFESDKLSDRLANFFPEGPCLTCLKRLNPMSLYIDVALKATLIAQMAR